MVVVKLVCDAAMDVDVKKRIEDRIVSESTDLWVMKKPIFFFFLFDLSLCWISCCSFFLFCSVLFCSVFFDVFVVKD